MKTGVLLLNFGEPDTPDMGAVVPFLERIFTANASLDGPATPDAVVARSRELALHRAPALVEAYREIGGSPLNRQAAAQANALHAELARRGLDVTTYSGMQFTEPSIRAVAETARDDGVRRLVALPVYPLCGASTTVAALADLERALHEMEWDIECLEIAGWHRHPLYVELRADGIRETARRARIRPGNSRVRVVFSAHGTPVRYLREGSRYDAYAREHCEALARALGIRDYVLGFQNHANRPVEWTQPDVERAVAGIDADAIIVVPISFMHEQSETLADLDHGLREIALKSGLAFHRVPVPHDDARFITVLADLVEARLDGPDIVALHSCRCRRSPLARCTNGADP